MDMLDDEKKTLEYINNSIIPKETEKKLYGEVFTPLIFVNELLDQLPITVWSDRRLKWFEPSCGIGNFIIIIYYRLLNGLSEIIPDNNERKNHILKNMLYMAEFNKNNVEACKKILGDNINIYEGDSLLLDISSYFNVSKFDIIIGNPPFNSGGINSSKNKTKGIKSLWMPFVLKSMNIWLKPDGYLVFITPLAWLRDTNIIHHALSEKTFLWLRLLSIEDSYKFLKVFIAISFYVMKNTINTNKTPTNIKFLNNELIPYYLNPNLSIPMSYPYIFEKLLNFINKYDLEFDIKTNRTKTNGDKIALSSFGLNYKTDDLLNIDTYTVKDGIKIKKSIKQHIDADKKKLVFCRKIEVYGFIDDGRLGVAGNNNYYILGDKLELLLKMFNFKFVKIISDYTKYYMSYINLNFFKYMPDIRKLSDIQNIEEIDFYRLVGFNVDEINLINNI